MTVFFIAEAGVNHNGDLALAHELIRVAKKSGAHAVKFQTFKAEQLASAEAAKADYQIQQTGSGESQQAMLKKLELGLEAFKELKAACEQQQIEFMSTAFDSESLKFLVEDLGLSHFKIPSGEITNAPFLLEHARYALKLEHSRIILSTGMASLSEIESALGVLAFGLLNEAGVLPSEKAFARAWNLSEGRAKVKEKVSLLHCTTSYPTPYTEVNLRAMATLRQAFDCEVGYSDHTEGGAVSIAATALGATIIEKHFTLDRTMDGPDHQASLEPDELEKLIRDVQAASEALGSSVKFCGGSESKNKVVARKSLVAATAMTKGQRIDTQNLQARRPDTGISPFKYWDILGQVATKDYQAGDVIKEGGWIDE